MNEALRLHLQTLLGPRSHRDLPVVDFVRLVYNFRLEDIPRRTYYLPRVYCQRFCNARTEIASYEPLEKIFESLKNQVYRNVNNLPLDSNMFCLENTVPKGNYAVFKPDFLCTTHSLRGPWVRQQWNTALASGEVKRSDGLFKHLTYERKQIDLNILFLVS